MFECRIYLSFLYHSDPLFCSQCNMILCYSDWYLLNPNNLLSTTAERSRMSSVRICSVESVSFVWYEEEGKSHLREWVSKFPSYKNRWILTDGCTNFIETWVCADHNSWLHKFHRNVSLPISWIITCNLWAYISLSFSTTVWHSRGSEGMTFSWSIRSRCLQIYVVVLHQVG